MENLVPDTFDEIVSRLDLPSTISLSLVSKYANSHFPETHPCRIIELNELMLLNIKYNYIKLNRWLNDEALIPRERKNGFYLGERPSLHFRGYVHPVLETKSFEHFLLIMEIFELPHEMVVKDEKAVELLASIDSEEARAYALDLFDKISIDNFNKPIILQRIIKGAIKSESLSHFANLSTKMNFSEVLRLNDDLRGTFMSCDSMAFVEAFYRQHFPERSFADDVIRSGAWTHGLEHRSFFYLFYSNRHRFSGNLFHFLMVGAVTHGDLGLFNGLRLEPEFSSFSLSSISIEKIVNCKNFKLFEVLVELVKENFTLETLLADLELAKFPERLRHILRDVKPDENISDLIFRRILSSGTPECLKIIFFENYSRLGTPGGAKPIPHLWAHYPLDNLKFLLDFNLVEITPETRKYFMGYISYRMPLHYLKYFRSKGFEWSGKVLQDLVTSRCLYRVKYALENGCPTSTSCLFLAVEQQCPRIIRLLLKYKSPIGILKKEFLETGSQECIDVFKEFGVYPSEPLSSRLKYPLGVIAAVISMYLGYYFST